MKTNLFALLAVFLMLTSCSRSEDVINEETVETPFFNLKVGNEWVYKTYDRADYNSEFKFSGKIDTLKIINEVSLNNKKYFKVEHSYKENVNPDYMYYEYWRVNDKGHLLGLDSYNFDQGNNSDNLERVKHPGKDLSYTYKDNGYIEFGDLFFKIYPETTITINNQIYQVLPYNGQFTPNAQNPNIIPKLVEYNYKEGVGLVKFVSHSVVGTYNFEDRLESYSLK